MIKKKVTIGILSFVLLLSLVLRLYLLETLPQILNRDEAGLAYNALLLKETGKDEWGRTWPLSLESFGDYKLPGYPVLLVIFFSFFGENDFVVRLPSALAGVAIILLGFVIARQSKWSNRSALMLSVVLATTPIYFFYSRIAFEAMVGLVFLISALVCVFASTEERRKRHMLDVFGIVLWGMAALTYNTPLLYIPFFLFVIPISRGIKNVTQWLLPVLGLLLLFVGLCIGQMNLATQKSSITIFSDETLREQANEWYTSFNGANQTLVGNKYVYFGRQIVKNTFSTLSPAFLISKGGAHPLHQMPGTGHLLVTVYIFGLLGLVLALGKIIKKARSFKNWKKFYAHTSLELLLVYSSIISLAPSVVTVDAPHATRSLFFFFCISVASVYAIRQLKGNIGSLFIVVTVVLFAEYVSMYFSEYPNKQPSLLGVGYDTVIQEVDKTSEGEVAIVDPDGYQYILTAWYLKTEPSVFFDTIIKQLPNAYGFRYGQQMDRFHFIGNAEDRVETEKTVVEWRGDSWQVETY